MDTQVAWAASVRLRRVRGLSHERSDHFYEDNMHMSLSAVTVGWYTTRRARRGLVVITDDTARIAGNAWSGYTAR